ncbi:hypothetical protein BJ085DRAFT_19778 [Dimargaris cristalligena]|uniref:THIF-type NAD/FAD binding fold domain-containing protein n=1 Tax=Dimargaris cristalligena TaxID=215637 RepID=A0A4P9ZWN0_9FUNG|nr:hypothetical protein BJ085DRAFT_19778 [Dimargaris cristalligena]|eukprot:RKP38054.1 hypothetical protein BJ085DRAFT_19778 [Dimargaris cristalligena]
MDKGGNFPTGATTITQSTTTHPEFLVREQLARNIAFLGEDGVARLRRARVVVVGAGGVGSWATVMLARSGVEYIRVIDFDQVTLSSLNRHAVATLADVGTPKVVALKNRLAQVTPQVTIDARVTLFDKSSAPTLLEGGDRGPIDMVLDCIDHIDTKLELLHYCHTHQLPVISAMGAGAKCDPSRVQISDISETFEDPLARAVRRSLKKMGVNGGIPVVYSTEKPGQVRLLPLDESRVADADEFAVLPDFRARILPVLGTLPAIFGMAMATYVICQLAAFPLEPLAIKQRDALYHRLHRDLCNRDGHHHHHQKGVPLSQDDVAYSFEEIWRGRSVISGSFEKPALTRWHHDQPLSLQNCVCMTKHEASIHDALTVPPEEYYPSDVVERVQARFREEMRLGQWR